MYSCVYLSICLHVALSVSLALFYWSNVFYKEICEWHAAATSFPSPICCLSNKCPHMRFFSPNPDGAYCFKQFLDL